MLKLCQGALKMFWWLVVPNMFKTFYVGFSNSCLFEITHDLNRCCKL